MVRFSLFLLTLIALSLGSAPSLAATTRVQLAAGADVYEDADFETKVIEHIPPKTFVKMRVSKQVGRKGIGLFYKVRTPGGRIGYISDSDLLATAKPESDEAVTRFALGAGAFVFGDSVRGTNRSAAQYWMSFRRIAPTFPRWHVGTEIGLIFVPGAPKFLAASGAYGSTNGFQLIVPVLFQYQILSGKWTATAGLGPSVSYMKYSTNYIDGPYSTSKTRFGVLTSATVGHKFQFGEMRVELMYGMDGSSRMGGLLSLVL